MNINNISYSNDFEHLLKDEAEKSESMSLLHIKSYEKYSFLSIILNIPVIVLSSVIGFLSPLSLFEHQTIFLGSLSILVAILKTIDNYFDLTKRCETHRMTSLNYSRVSKYIQLQLSLEKEVRVNAKDLFDIINNELQNIREGEPIIPDGIIKDFNLKYKHEATSKPAITNGLTKVKICKKSIYRPHLNNISFAIESSRNRSLSDDNITVVSRSNSLGSPIVLPINEEIVINNEPIVNNEEV